MHGQAGLVRQQFEEVGGRPLQRDLEAAVVDGLDAEFVEPGPCRALLIFSALRMG